MQQNTNNTAPMLSKETRMNRKATRFAVNHDWCYRGDNTKPKAKK